MKSSYLEKHDMSSNSKSPPPPPTLGSRVSIVTTSGLGFEGLFSGVHKVRKTVSIKDAVAHGLASDASAFCRPFDEKSTFRRLEFRFDDIRGVHVHTQGLPELLKVLASEENSEEFVKKWVQTEVSHPSLAEGAAPDSNVGVTALMMACDKGRAFATRHLLRLGADWTRGMVGTGNISVHFAASSGSVECLEALLFAAISDSTPQSEEGATDGGDADEDHLWLPETPNANTDSPTEDAKACLSQKAKAEGTPSFSSASRNRLSSRPRCAPPCFDSMCAVWGGPPHSPFHFLCSLLNAHNDTPLMMAVSARQHKAVKWFLATQRAPARAHSVGLGGVEWTLSDRLAFEELTKRLLAQPNKPTKECNEATFEDGDQRREKTTRKKMSAAAKPYVFINSPSFMPSWSPPTSGRQEGGAVSQEDTTAVKTAVAAAEVAYGHWEKAMTRAMLDHENESGDTALTLALATSDVLSVHMLLTIAAAPTPSHVRLKKDPLHVAKQVLEVWEDQLTDPAGPDPPASRSMSVAAAAKCLELVQLLLIGQQQDRGGEACSHQKEESGQNHHKEHAEMVPTAAAATTTTTAVGSIDGDDTETTQQEIIPENSSNKKKKKKKTKNRQKNAKGSGANEPQNDAESDNLSCKKDTEQQHVDSPSGDDDFASIGRKGQAGKADDHTADNAGGDLNADAVSALGLELDMLLLGPQALALELSPSQLEALGEFRRIATVQETIRTHAAAVAAASSSSQKRPPCSSDQASPDPASHSVPVEEQQERGGEDCSHQKEKSGRDENKKHDKMVPAVTTAVGSIGGNETETIKHGASHNSSSSSSKRKKKKREKKKNKDGNASYEGDKEQQHAGESSGGDNFASIERMVEEGNDEKEGDNEQDSDNDNDETNAGGGGDDDSAVHSADSCDWRTESDEDGEDEDEQKRQQHRRRCSSFHAIMRSAFCAKTDDEAAAPTYDDGACPSVVGTLGCGDGRKRLGKETPRRGGNAGSGGMSKAIAGDNGWRFVSSDDNVDGIDNDHTADKDGGDLDADAVSALGLELDMLLLGPQALALALSPSQVEALGKFLANRIAAVQDARVLQARVAAMNEARNALGISS